MLEVYKLIGRVAASDVTALVLGESGTGKELVADAIHAFSGRSGGPLIKVNCAAFPILFWNVLRQVEARLIHAALLEAHGNKAEAARILDIRRRLLYEKLTELGMN